MITVGETKLAVSKIIQRKREKNNVERNNGRQPHLILVATFEEIQKEIEKQHGKSDVTTQELGSMLNELIHSGWLRPACGAFVPRKQLLGESESVTEHWEKPLKSASRL